MEREADDMNDTRLKGKLSLLVAAGAFAAAAGLAAPTWAGAVESKDPIKLTIHDWTGQYVTTHIRPACSSPWATTSSW